MGRTAWEHSVRRAASQFKRDRSSLVAAGMAFYWFLGIFPLFIAAVGIVGLVRLEAEAVDDLTRGIARFVPGDAADVLSQAVRRAGTQSSGTSVISAVVGITAATWSASSGMVAMQRGLGITYEVPQIRKFAAARVRALMLLGVTGTLGGVATLLTVVGKPLGELLADMVDAESWFNPVWAVVRWSVAALTLLTLFSVFYYLAPNRDSPRWTWISAGSIFATVIWLLGSAAFSLYVTSLGGYAHTYGSLAGVVVLLMWLYLSGVAVMVGGHLNAELEREAALITGQVSADSVPGNVAHDETGHEEMGHHETGREEAHPVDGGPKNGVSTGRA